MAAKRNGISLDEQLRLQEDDLLRQQRELERLERERIEAEEKAAEDTAKAEQAANEAAEQATEAAQTEPPVADSSISGAGVRSFGPGKISAEDRLNMQFANETRDAIEDTRFKIGKYDTEEGYTPEESRGMFVNRLASHALGAPAEEEAGNQAYIDYNSIRNKEQAFAMLMTYSDDAAKVKGGKKMAASFGMSAEAFLAEAENYMFDKYGRNVFSSPYSNAAKNRAYNSGVQSIGLTGVDGQQLDPYKMTTADVMLACRMDPSGDTADAMYELAKAGAKVPGNPWYGQNVTKAMFEFVDSADLTKADYNEEISVSFNRKHFFDKQTTNAIR